MRFVAAAILACTVVHAADDRPILPTAPTGDASQFWSYRPVRRPAVPDVSPGSTSAPSRRSWSRNPIDAFIAVEHAKRGLVPNSPADPAVLLRRVYLDLVGVPPTRDELLAFLADSSDEAYERVVERLLASPLYGERWGRHWMDVWRYSDWYGSRGINEIRYSQRHIWRWRDWIVDSLNADKGYDRMIVEMLAGDELAPGDPDVTRATGFIGRNWYKFDRNVWMFDAVEHTAQAFLGVTLKCARCHEHKYDPIPQRDYYRFRAFFEPHDVRTDPISCDTATEKDATLGQVLKVGVAHVYDKQLDAPTFVFTRGDNRYPDESQRVEPGVPAVFGFDRIAIQPVPLPVEAVAPWLRPSLIAERSEAARTGVRAAEAAANEARTAAATAERRLAEEIRRGPEGGLQTVAEWETTLKLAQRNAHIADQKVAMARSELAAFEARVAADRATLGDAPHRSPHAPREVSRSATDPPNPNAFPDAADLAKRAAQAERQAKLAQAELDVSTAEHALLAARLAARNPAATVSGGNAQASQKTQVASPEMLVANAESKLAAARKARDAARVEAAKIDTTYTPIGPTYPATSTGRRLALARWIADPRNPRTARVAVNHIWLRHFGQPLVLTVANFGMNGSPPTHPELLDWLAAELMQPTQVESPGSRVDGPTSASSTVQPFNRPTPPPWRMKHLHRLIVTSRTYRMASTTAGAPNQNVANDPENRFLWRMNSRRMESEAVRDSLLYVAGQLDLARGGPEIDESLGQQSRRRSLYFRSTPNEKMAFLELFDQANPNECYRRQESVVPQQSLVLTNSALSLNQARLLARAITAQVGGQDSPSTRAAFVRRSFEQILSRTPTPDECAACEKFLVQHAALLHQASRATFAPAAGPAANSPATEPHLHARENLVHVLVNHNDFVTIR